MSAYCSGISTKKHRKSGTWSAGLVGVSVTNSRSAKNDIAANSSSVAIGPARNATAKMPTITHQARIRLLRLAMTERAASVPARAANSAPTSEAISSSVTTPPISQ
jgi:hypothetical protein